MAKREKITYGKFYQSARIRKLVGKTLAAMVRDDLMIELPDSYLECTKVRFDSKTGTFTFTTEGYYSGDEDEQEFKVDRRQFKVIVTEV